MGVNLNLQNAASPLMEQLNYFHDWVIVFVVAIAVAVLSYLVLTASLKPSHRALLEAQDVEFI